MRRSVATGVAVLAAASMLALLGALALTGKTPGMAAFQRFVPNGIVAAAPDGVARIEIAAGDDRLVFYRRSPGQWMSGDAAGSPVPDSLADHLETALRFLHVSAPTRVLAPEEYRGADFAAFGLDPPQYLVSLTRADGGVTSVDFGLLNPPQTSQYVHLVGRPDLYLMPRHVGAEWRLAMDMASRAQQGGDERRTGFLLPVSLAQIWAVEIVAGGALHRFQRDAAGNWFLHTGQHSHIGLASEHVADPREAAAIAQGLAAFERTRIEQIVAASVGEAELARYGLTRPPLIVLLYARDDSRPAAQFALGDVAADGFNRYVLLRDSGAVVTIPDYAARHLSELLKSVGVAS